MNKLLNFDFNDNESHVEIKMSDATIVSNNVNEINKALQSCNNLNCYNNVDNCFEFDYIDEERCDIIVMFEVNGDEIEIELFAER